MDFTLNNNTVTCRKVFFLLSTATQSSLLSLTFFFQYKINTHGIYVSAADNTADNNRAFVHIRLIFNIKLSHFSHIKPTYVSHYHVNDQI